MAKIAVKNRWSLKQDILTLFYAFRDARTPWYAKVTSLSSLIYLLSPADLLPDLIPFAGYIDDLIIVPFILNISTKLLPSDVKKAAQDKAKQKNKKLWWVLALAILVIISILILLFYAGTRLFSYFSDSGSVTY